MTEGHTGRLEAALDGKYRIERKLGEGGMASVYLAEDIKHHRKVALKILKPELAAVIGAERFLSEIRTTANLQHPHILALFDSGEAGGYLYYVMPYIEGETLRDKLDREKQLGVEESVRIARDVADALDYAHRAGVIHRDIKPANILLHDGRPVVADFGIALAVSAAGGGRMTETGLSLGTPHYMSPEQASADRDLSARSDVYSLGCVLYEMIGGQPPHSGPSAQSILVHILTEEAKPLSKLRHTVPPNVAATVAKSIEKLPADRFESARAFMDALGDEAFSYQAGPRDAATPVVARAAVGPIRAWNRLTAGFATLAAVLGALAAWGWLQPEPQLPTALMRFTFVPPESAPLNLLGTHPDLAISPDGTLIVYKGPSQGGPQLNIRALDQASATPLRGSEGGLGPVVSPDGDWVAFVDFNSQTTLKRVSTLGGAPMTLAESPQAIYGVSWGTDDQIIFGTRGGGLFRIPAGGGVEPEALTTPDAEGGDNNHSWPSIIDGRRAVVFVISNTTPLDDGQLAVLDLDSGDVTPLGLAGVSPRYVSTGHLVYAAEDGSVRAVPFDAQSLTVTGSAVPLVEGIATKPSGAAAFDVSADGHLIYVSGGGGAEPLSLVWVDRDGREEPIGADPLPYVYPRLSPDGQRLALSAGGGEPGLRIWDFGAETLTRMILGDGEYLYPVWTPDGERIVYSERVGTEAAGQDLYWKPYNRGTPEVLAEGVRSDGTQQPEAYFFTPDGTALVFREQATPTGDDLVMVPLGADTVGWRLDGDFNERNAELSPNGRWMAYQSDESGEWEVYVRPFPEVLADQVQVSNNGGLYPLWSRDGRELFYLQSGVSPELVSVSVAVEDAGQRFAFNDREALLEWPYLNAGSDGRNYDVSPDGQRFVAIKEFSGGAGARPEIAVVLNWFTELRERMGGN